MSHARSPQAAELLAHAQALAPVIEAEAEEAESLGRLTEKTEAALRDSGLFDIMMPALYGGPEADPVTQALVFEELARADGSAGWVVMAAATCSGMAATYMDQDEADAMFEGRRNVVLAGHAAPLGQAVAADGRFRVDGAWHFGSGTAHADYVIGGCMVVEDGAPRKTPAGLPEMRILHFRRDDVEFLGNWDVMGLRASGSFDYRVSGLSVPEGRSYVTMDTEPKRGGPLYRLGMLGLVASGHAAYALGVARRALDEVAEVSKSRQRPPNPVLAEQPVFQDQYAHAEARLRAARAFLHEALGVAYDTVMAGGRYGLEQRAPVRLATSHATEVAAEVTAFAYHAAGSRALRNPSALQRCFRDINAGTQHAFVDPGIWLTGAKVLLGTAPEGTML